MLRQVALDTETTGKNDDGTPGEHRIIEVGCVEIIDRRITGRELRYLINPDRPIDEEAERVHGISIEMLQDKPHFADIADELIDFIRGSELLIHNARFDTAFLDKEWALLKKPERTADLCHIVDTVALARKINPNNQANLDNLCRVYDIDNSRRTQHGALLDAELLAEVYLAMTGGQSSLEFGEVVRTQSMAKRWQRPQGLTLPLMGVEKERHVLHVKTMLQLSQTHKVGSTEDGQAIAGSDWSAEFNMPMLSKGPEEGKKEFAGRLKAQYEEKLKELLPGDDLTVLNEVLARQKAEFQAWEDRVNGKV